MCAFINVFVTCAFLIFFYLSCITSVILCLCMIMSVVLYFCIYHVCCCIMVGLFVCCCISYLCVAVFLICVLLYFLFMCCCICGLMDKLGTLLLSHSLPVQPSQMYKLCPFAQFPVGLKKSPSRADSLLYLYLYLY